MYAEITLCYVSRCCHNITVICVGVVDYNKQRIGNSWKVGVTSGKIIILCFKCTNNILGLAEGPGICKLQQTKNREFLEGQGYFWKNNNFMFQM